MAIWFAVATTLSISIRPRGFIIFEALMYAYFFILEIVLVATAGGSLGKLALELRVVRSLDQPKPPGLRKSIRRVLGPGALFVLAIVVSELLDLSVRDGDLLINGVLCAIAGLSLWGVLTDSERRSLLDRSGGTRVVRIQAPKHH